MTILIQEKEVNLFMEKIRNHPFNKGFNKNLDICSIIRIMLNYDARAQRSDYYAGHIMFEMTKR